jgi:hypothetical protein
MARLALARIVRLTVDLTARDHDALLVLARRTGRTPSEFILEALRDVLESVPAGRALDGKREGAL